MPHQPETLITCNPKDPAEFSERGVAGAWITRKIEPHMLLAQENVHCLILDRPARDTDNT